MRQLGPFKEAFVEHVAKGTAGRCRDLLVHYHEETLAVDGSRPIVCHEAGGMSLLEVARYSAAARA